MKSDDISGKRYGNLVAMSRCGSSKSGHAMWTCRCDCGSDVKVLATNLKTKTKSCGCLRKKASALSTINLIGQRFGRLTVIGDPDRSNRTTKFRCRCDCGATVNVWSNSLRRGITKSCGCLNRESITKHGMHSSPEYTAYRNMLARCLDPKNPGFRLYGERGISVCQEWLGDGGFIAFINDMGPRPSKRHSLDRIDNDSGYNKNNCRWASLKQQSGNKRNTKMVRFNNQLMLASEFADHIGSSRSNVYRQLMSGRTADEIALRFSRKNSVLIKRGMSVKKTHTL